MGKKGDTLLTTKEVADRLSITPSAVRVYCWRGQQDPGQAVFPGARHYGRDWLVPLSDVEGYIKRRREPGRPKKAAAKKH